MLIKRHLKKIVAFALIGIILTFSTTGFCGDSHDYNTSCESACNIPPTSPVDEHSGDDHEKSACYCACHLPLTCSTISISYLPHMSLLTAFEPFKAFPEIYLDKFIPPQNLA